MVEPLAADLFTGAVPHCLFDIVALFVCVQRIEPHKHGVFILRLKLRLTVDCPGEIPVIGAVLYGDDSASCYLARAGVALAYIHNVTDYFIVGGSHSGAHPVGGVHIRAEFIGVAVFAVLCLCRNGLPHIPGFPRAVFNAGKIGSVGLISVAGGVGAAAVGDKYKVVLGKVDGLLPAVLNIDYLLCRSFFSLGFDDYIFNVHTVFDRYAVGLKIFYEREDHAFILIIFCEPQSAEIGQSVDVVDIAAEIALHFKGA